MGSILAFPLILICFHLTGNGAGSQLDSSLPVTPYSSFQDSTESPDLLKVVQDELDDLKKDLTRSFITQHSRRKREILKYSYEATVSENAADSFETRTDPSGYSCLYKNQTYRVQSDGIYRLDGLLDSPEVEAPTRPSLVKVTSWTLGRGERVLTTQEWDGFLFLVTANEDGSYCKVYTVHGHTYIVTPRQEIRNDGHATAAALFVHSYDLYLVITTDNKAHSITISPIYRWARTYMDRIHEIQTRGAIGVVAFPVSSYTYVAIAQAEDAAGNYEVGTLVVRVYRKGELEKVQLLWSIQPVSVTYVRFLEEHFLVIGQRKESSICYWFGGYQFVYWQSLDGLTGNSIFLDSWVLPDREPLLLTSTASVVSLYTRTNNPHQRDTSLLNRTSVVYTTSGFSERILDARFLKRVSTSSAPFLYLALTLQSSSGMRFKVVPLSLVKVALGEDQVDPEDKVSRCISSLRDALDLDEPSLSQLDTSQGSILTRSGDWTVTGSLISKGSVTLSPAVIVNSGHVTPDLEYAEDRYTNSPSLTLQKAEIALEEFQNFLETQIGNVLLKSKPGNISAHFTFGNGLRIRNLNSYSPINLETLNGIPWTELETGILRTRISKPQLVSGNWEIGTLKTLEIDTGHRIGDAFIGDFLLTTSTPGQRKEVLKGPLTFEKNVDMELLQLGPYSTLNGIPITEIAFQSDKDREIRGYKHGETVKGGTQLDIGLINGIKLSEWYDGILKMGGVAEERSTGTKTFSGDLTINALTVETLNGRNWDDFVASVLINGQDQTVYGDLSTNGKLKVEALQVETINGVGVDDWMTTSTNQDVRSEIVILGELKLRGNLVTESINGIRLSEGVRRTETDVRIQGPLELNSLALGNLTFDPYTTLNNLHISSAAKQRKKHIYDSASGEGITLDGNVEVGELESSALNGLPFNSLSESYWRSNVNNQIPSNFNFGSAKVVVEGEFWTETLNSAHPETDIVRTSTDGLVRRNVQFSSDVIVKGPLAMANGATINSYDISQVEKDIVRTTDGPRRIGGRKTFEDPIEARGGIRLGEVNGISLEREVVFLEGYGTHVIRGKKFKDVLVSPELESEVDIVVGGTVNGEKLDEIGRTTVYEDQEIIKIRGNVVFEKSITAESLTVLNEINGIKLGDIVGNVIGLDQEVKLTTPITLSKGNNLKFLESAQVSTINGINPKEYLARVVSRKDDVEFGGKKLEFGHVIVDGDLSCDFLNSINLTALEASAFSKTRNQFISGKFTFQELESRGNLITATLSGVPVTSILRTDRDGRVEGDVLFKSKSTEVKSQILLHGFLNNYKIEEVAEYLGSLGGNRKFTHVTVTGNLSWENSDHSLHRLSHLFQNAVTIGSPQKLTGKVDFGNGLDVDSLFTEKWINGVDLNFILSDSVQWNRPTEFTGLITFAKGLRVGHGPVTIAGQLNTLRVNNVTLKDLVQEVVSIDTPRRIYGTKTFLKGISTRKLIVYGSIDNVYPKDLVTNGDQRLVDKITMSHVSILQNLDYKKLIGYELEGFLHERMTLDQDHRISSDWTFHRDLIIQNCEAYSINGLRLDDILHRKSPTPQRVTGLKTFQNLIIQGSLEDVAINGIRLDHVGQEVLGLERDEVIQRHVTFVDTVHLANGVKGGINENSIGPLAEAFTDDLQRLVTNVLVTPETKERTTDLILELEKTQEMKAVWLDFVEGREWLGKFLPSPTVRVETFVHPEEGGKLTLAFHGPTLATGGTLPIGCSCNSIQFLHLDSSVELIGSVDCVNIFDVIGGNSVSYTIYSHVVSYNKTCSRKETGETFVSISPKQDRRYAVKHGGSVGKPDWSIGRLDEIGFVSDVKGFVIGSKSYLVIAQSYDPYGETEDAEVIVYDTTYDKLDKVQGIPAHGARRLAMDMVDGNWILVIGNSGGEPCQETSSSIHQWSPQVAQFSLLRDVKTVDLVDVALLSMDKDGYFHEAYAAFAQNEPDGEFGTVALYKYSANNFHFFQSLENAGRIGALQGFSVAQFSYLILAVPAAGLQFYEYGHVEGFKLRLEVPLKGANDAGLLIRRGEVFFPVALGNKGVGGILTEGIFQGRLN